jgi:hypothetical protein
MKSRKTANISKMRKLRKNKTIRKYRNKIMGGGGPVVIKDVRKLRETWNKAGQWIVSGKPGSNTQMRWYRKLNEGESMSPNVDSELYIKDEDELVLKLTPFVKDTTKYGVHCDIFQ